MATLCKQTLLKIIEESQCHADLAPLISLLPFNTIKTTLYNYVQNELTETDKVRKEYYNRSNITDLLPEALISKILTYLPFKETSRCCRISSIFNESSNVALYHTKIALNIDAFEEYYDCNRKRRQQDHIQYLSDITIEPKLPTFEIKFVKFEKFLNNNYMKKFMNKYWNRIIHLNITNSLTNINKLFHSFDLKITKNLQSMINFYPLKDDIDNESDSEEEDSLQYYNFNYLQIGITKGLEFICLPFQGQKTWNIIIENCPNLHGIIFNIDLNDFSSEIIKSDGFKAAPNLWTLTIDSDDDDDDDDDDDIGVDLKFLNRILKSCPNLYHLSIGFNIININNNDLQLATKNLISLSLSFIDDVVLKKCKRLKYLNIPWQIQLNNNIDEYIDALYKMITIFINNNGIFIGINDSSDNFEDSVNDILEEDDRDEDEALDSIFNRLKEILIDRYKCNINNNNDLIILMDDELDEEEQMLAKRLGMITFGCSEIRCRKISQQQVIKVVVEHVLDESNEFRLFIEKISNGSIIDDLIDDGVFL